MNTDFSLMRESKGVGFLVDLSEYVVDLTDMSQGGDAVDPRGLESIEFDMPFELEETFNGDGSISLQAGPPTQQIETSTMPVIHRMRMFMKVEYGEQE